MFTFVNARMSHFIETLLTKVLFVFFFSFFSCNSMNDTQRRESIDNNYFEGRSTITFISGYDKRLQS